MPNSPHPMLLRKREQLIAQQIVIEEKIMSLTEYYHSERNNKQVPKGWNLKVSSAFIRDLQIEYSANEATLKIVDSRIQLEGAAK